MSKTAWIWIIVGLILVGGAGFWSGMTYAQSQTPGVASRSGGAGGIFAGGRAGFGGGTFAGGGTVGTIIQMGNGSFTVQLPTSTSTTATTGTKLILVNDSTQVQELQSVPVSNLQVGQIVTVAGSANTDGSITASNVTIRPSGGRGAGAGAATQASGQ